MPTEPSPSAPSEAEANDFHPCDQCGEVVCDTPGALCLECLDEDEA